MGVFLLLQWILYCEHQYFQWNKQQQQQQQQQLLKQEQQQQQQQDDLDYIPLILMKQELDLQSQKHSFLHRKQNRYQNATFGNCTPTWLTFPSTNIASTASSTITTHNEANKPMFLASLSGSGAELFSNRMEIYTGYTKLGWSVYEAIQPPFVTCLDIHAAICRIHWPMLDHVNVMDDYYLHHYHSHVIVFLRNPKYILFERFRRRWNEQQKQKQKHEHQQHQYPPEQAWIRYISRTTKKSKAEFHTHRNQYKQFLLWWLSTSSYQIRSIVSYEQIMANPDISWNIIRYHIPHLSKLVSPSSRSCLDDYVWNQSHKKVPNNHDYHDHDHHQHHPSTYQPGMTLQQQALWIQLIDDLVIQIISQSGTTNDDPITNLTSHKTWGESFRNRTTSSLSHFGNHRWSLPISQTTKNVIHILQQYRYDIQNHTTIYDTSTGRKRTLPKQNE